VHTALLLAGPLTAVALRLQQANNTGAARMSLPAPPSPSLAQAHSEEDKGKRSCIS